MLAEVEGDDHVMLASDDGTGDVGLARVLVVPERMSNLRCSFLRTCIQKREFRIANNREITPSYTLFFLRKSLLNLINSRKHFFLRDSQQILRVDLVPRAARPAAVLGQLIMEYPYQFIVFFNFYFFVFSEISLNLFAKIHQDNLYQER